MAWRVVGVWGVPLMLFKGQLYMLCCSINLYYLAKYQSIEKLYTDNTESKTIMEITSAIILSSKYNEPTLRNTAINIYVPMNSMG